MADVPLDTGAAPAASETPDLGQAVKDSALASLAKPEDISGYVAERTDREKESKGEEVNTEARARRIQEALAKARQDTAEARQQNGLGEQQDNQPPDLDRAYEAAEA